MLTLLMLVGAFGAVFFLIRGVQGRTAIHRMTRLEVRRAELDEARARDERLPWTERLRRTLRQNGYDSGLFPFFAATGFGYLFILIFLRVVGLAYPFGAVIALPIAAACTAGVISIATGRRHRRFNRQLVELLDLVAGQVQAGHGSQKALSIIAPSMMEPLRSEMLAALERQRATKDLVGSIAELGERYPSRAMDMFVSALEIDRADGQAIGPALKQAAELLKQDFALAAEATAEISQTRGEFLGVVAILAGIAAKMIFGSGASAMHTYTSGVGLVILTVGVANMAFGIWRFLRMLKTIRGEA